MVAKKQKQVKEPIKAAPYASLSEEEILAMAKEINDRNKPLLERMPISSPEQSRAFLEACGYDNLPPVNPTFSEKVLDK